MSQFLLDLFSSIFIPGPTDTLLAATNATFASLQLLLLVLLLATFSVHFLILSFLSGGLWWAINWFAAELRQAQAAERAPREPADHADDGSDTEAETVIQAGDRAPDAQPVPNPTAAPAALRARRGGTNKSETSTEDEWERV